MSCLMRSAHSTSNVRGYETVTLDSKLTWRNCIWYLDRSQDRRKEQVHQTIVVGQLPDGQDVQHSSTVQDISVPISSVDYGINLQ